METNNNESLSASSWNTLYDRFFEDSGLEPCRTPVQQSGQRFDQSQKSGQTVNRSSQNYSNLPESARTLGNFHEVKTDFRDVQTSNNRTGNSIDNSFQRSTSPTQTNALRSELNRVVPESDKMSRTDINNQSGTNGKEKRCPKSNESTSKENGCKNDSKVSWITAKNSIVFYFCL